MKREKVKLNAEGDQETVSIATQNAYISLSLLKWEEKCRLQKEFILGKQS